MRALQFMWDGGETRRYHVFRTLMEDTVGHHSYNVACTIMFVRPNASAKLLRAALKHDMAEHITGDMPAPTKRSMPDYHERRSFREEYAHYEEVVARGAGLDLEQDLSPEEAWVLKFADSLDGMRFCANERQLGNKTARLTECFEAFDSYVCKLLFGDEHLDFENVALLNPLTEHATEIDRTTYLYVRRQWSAIR